MENNRKRRRQLGFQVETPGELRGSLGEQLGWKGLSEFNQKNENVGLFTIPGATELSEAWESSIITWNYFRMTIDYKL